MKNWTIGKRITWGGGLLLALLIIVGVISVSSLSKLKKQAADISENAMPSVDEISEITFNMYRGYVRTVMASGETKVEARDKNLAQAAEAVAKVAELQDEYEKTILIAEDRANFEAFKKRRADYAEARGQLVAMIKADKSIEEKNTFLQETLDPSFSAYRDQAKVILDWNNKDGLTHCTAMQASAQRTTMIVSIVAVVSTLLAVFLGVVIIRGINGVLKLVSNSLNDGAHQVVSAASQVSASSQTLSEGSSEQASSLEETSSSLEEMSSMIKRNSEHALKANDLAKEARTAADKGVGDMQTMATAMEAIKVSSDDIAKIIKTIDEIAFQTNILALNAAVEAARAGEAGMGFAVVADEVRNLAQRCAQAAKETAAKIEGAIAKSGQGVEITGKVATALNEIVTKVRQVDELVTEVAGASREQTQSITQINSAVGQMDKVTQGNAATAEECAAAAEELNAQAETMNRSVSELLRLVDGQGSTTAIGTAAPIPRAWHEAVTVSAAKQPTDKNNGNGHHVLKQPQLVASRKADIPMDDDFKNF
jgi:methyl-accepting chemotaxis protein